MKNSNTSERLKYIMALKGLKQVDILKMCDPICEKYNKKYDLKIKIKKSDLSQWISGLYEPSQRKLTVLAQALGVSETWLMGYDVPMNKNEEDMIFNFCLALYEMLRYCMLDVNTLSRVSGINVDRINELIHQNSFPTGAEIEKVASMYGLKKKNINELFDGTVVKRILEKYEDGGNRLIYTHRLGIEFENILTNISNELNIPLHTVKSYFFNQKTSSFVTYDDLYNFIKRVIKEKI